MRVGIRRSNAPSLPQTPRRFSRAVPEALSPTTVGRVFLNPCWLPRFDTRAPSSFMVGALWASELSRSCKDLVPHSRRHMVPISKKVLLAEIDGTTSIVLTHIKPQNKVCTSHRPPATSGRHDEQTACNYFIDNHGGSAPLPVSASAAEASSRRQGRRHWRRR
jgi:hypothetical protein